MTAGERAACHGVQCGWVFASALIVMNTPVTRVVAEKSAFSLPLLKNVGVFDANLGTKIHHPLFSLYSRTLPTTQSARVGSITVACSVVLAYPVAMKSALPIDRWAADVVRARKLAEEFAQSVRAKFADRVRRMLLYGSAVRGDWTTESDIDVLILLDRVNPEDMDWIIKQATSLGIARSGLLIQPLVLPESEFERLKRQERQFALEVDRTGEPL